MSRQLLAATVLGLTALGCNQRSYERDVEEVAERYPHRYQGETCSSWLTSATTGFRYCASPAFRVAVEDTTDPTAGAPEVEVDETAIDKDSLFAHGEVVYGKVCVACHQANGMGLAGTFPPLVGAGDYYGDPQNHAKIIVHGLSGEIVVNGETYNGVMPPQGATLSDYDVAAVATFVRFSWGNDDGIVVPADVAAIR